MYLSSLSLTLPTFSPCYFHPSPHSYNPPKPLFLFFLLIIKPLPTLSLPHSPHSLCLPSASLSNFSSSPFSFFMPLPTLSLPHSPYSLSSFCYPLKPLFLFLLPILKPYLPSPYPNLPTLYLSSITLPTLSLFSPFSPFLLSL